MRVEVTVSMDPFVNPALDGSLTGMRILRNVRIINNGERIDDGHLRVLTQPFITEFSSPVDLSVPEGGTIEVDVSDLIDVNPLHLLELPDSYISKLQVVLYKGDDHIVAESDVYNVRLLTCNTWPGCADRNLLCAFVVPTQPSVVEDVEPLRRSIRNSTSEEVAIAITRILRKRRMTRAEVPGNLFKRPHRFMMYEEMPAHDSCTSIDMALAFSAMAEALGLHPVIGIFADGVMTGLLDHPGGDWGTVTPVDPDLIFGGCNPSDIVSRSRHVDKGALDALVDVTHLRRRVQPIPYRLMEHGMRTYVSLDEVIDRTLPLRYMGWMSRLLDISLNNSLLSLGPKVARTLLDSQDQLDVLQDSLIIGNEFRTRFSQPGVDVGDMIEERRIPLDTHSRVAMDSIRQEIATNMRETGIGGGSIGLGMVSWRDARGRRHDAPLVLVSVDLRKVNEHSYALRHPDMEDAMVNIVLLERLRNEKGMAMPPLREYMSDGRVDMAPLIAHLTEVPGVEYHPAAFLGEFGLETNAMWNDLESNSSTILAHPLVRRLSKGEPLDTMGFIDPDFDMDDLHPVLPVDSSQIAAINAAVSGRSYVIRGPPGTGKSQTICNIICELLHRGRTVLFVSQKASALEIIDRKLSGMGLGDHCVAVYGKRARRSSVVDQLKAVVEACKGFDPGDCTVSRSVDTDALDRYYETMFGGTLGGDSFYAIYNRYLASQSVTNVLPEPDEDALEAFGKDIGALDSLISSLPSDDLLSAIPLSDLSEAMVRGDVEIDVTALEQASEGFHSLSEMLRRCGLGGEVSIDELQALVDGLSALRGWGLSPSDIDAFRERIHRMEGLNDVVLRCGDYIPTLDSYTDRDELLKTLGLLRNVLSDMGGSCPDGDIMSEPLGTVDLLISESEGMAPPVPWDEFTSGSDPGALRIAEDIRQTGLSPHGFNQVLHEGLEFLEQAYPGMVPNPFRISNTIRDLGRITRDWNPRIPVFDFRVAAQSLRSMVARIDAFIADMDGSMSKWEPFRDAGRIYLMSDQWFKEQGSGTVMRSMFDIKGYEKAVMSMFGAMLGYNSSLQKSQAFWHPSVYSMVDELLFQSEYIDDRKLMTRLNGDRSGFMKSIERTAKCKLKFNEVRDKLEYARSTRDDEYRAREGIRAYEKVRSTLIAKVSGLEALADDVEKAQRALPDWETLYQDGSLSNDDDNKRVEVLCKDIRSMLKDMGVSSKDMASVDLRDLSVLCDRIVSDGDRVGEYARLHDRCSRAVRDIPRYVKALHSRMRDIEGTIVRVHPDTTGIPMGCTLMLLEDSERIDATLSSCTSLIGSYDCMVCEENRSYNLDISGISDRLDLMVLHIWDIKGLQSFISSLGVAGYRFMQSMVDVLGRHPREAIVASLDAWFLGSILDAEIGRSFGIEDYGRGILPDYEEKVRESYDKMYACNRTNLAELLRYRASKVSSDPSLKALSSKDVPLSQILDSISHLISDMVPCFIMNVQSVSRFLGNSTLTFDYVIFDESSQIPVAESIPSLSKGDSCIIVGDTNQLPPTRFFRNNINDQAEGETESILEECIFKGMPSLELEWHYRSNHESLIAYSNSRFYDNRLITFPSVTDRVSKVDLRYVSDAVYMRGEGRNPIEASAVVDEIYRICSDPGYKGESIGVVTFGTSQKEAVEEALEYRRDREPLRYTNRREPLFIGNLESIQGEERSIILVSVGYGRDPDGRLSMNFGPLNQGRGWRRLNVAISRARDRMIVFSSMRPSDIRVDRNSGRGVRELRGFLEYAESGMFERKVTSADIIDPILPDVAKVVEDMGYETSLNIGKSELRIDVAVVDPGDPGKYCLAILLDRNLHDNSRNPVDRDYTKVRFLRKMGWKVLRVHTIDWMMDREATVRRIEENLPGNRG